MPNIGRFFFYSNDPEKVSTGLADNNPWLLKASVTGSGRVFYWHGNDLNRTINSGLYIFNPDPSKTITVTATYGLVPFNGPTGVDAWSAFFSGQAISPVQISPQTFSSSALFLQQISQGTSVNPTIYGVVADLHITDAQGNDAAAVLYDLAWISPNPPNLGALANQAPDDGRGRVRGLASNGYWVRVNLDPSQDTSSVRKALQSPRGFTIGANNPPVISDSFSGADLPIIGGTGPGTGPIQGAYGAQFCITWPVKNDATDGLKHSITLYAGNALNIPKTNFSINYQTGSGFGGCGNPSPALTQTNFIPIIQDTIAPGALVAYQFQIVTIGGFNYPLSLFVAET